MWAVKRGRNVRLFTDMMDATSAFNEASVGAQLWKLCPDGWVMISRMVPPPARRRQSNQPMNRETLVKDQ